jgi:uncharacterized sulfatase
MDLYHTLAAMLPGEESKEPADGMDLKALLQQPTGKLDRDALYFHYPHYYATTTPVSAVRAGDWKLLEYLEDGRGELYHLANDPGETRDLAAEQPDKTKELRAALEVWWKDTGAGFPTKNPAFEEASWWISKPANPKQKAKSK